MVEATQPGAVALPRLPVVLNASGKTSAVGPYRVVGQLGRGGMGVVYEVEHPDRRQSVALKMIESRYIGSGKEEIDQRFLHEISILQRLDHPGIVKLLDTGVAEHNLGTVVAFLVMERIEGPTLEQRLERLDGLSTREALRIVATLAKALIYLDAHDVTHRDVKPANIILEPDRTAVLMDFGLARSREFTRLTQFGQVIGTLSYMSPEALRDSPVDGRADVFSLGVVLYEMLVRENPYRQRDSTARLLEIKNGHEWPAEIEVPAQVRALVDDMLIYPPEDRVSAHDLQVRAEALAKTLGDSRPASLTAKPAEVIAADPLEETFVPPSTVVPTVADVEPAPLEDVEIPTMDQPAAEFDRAPPPLNRSEPRPLIRAGGPTWPGALMMCAFAVGTTVLAMRWLEVPPAEHRTAAPAALTSPKPKPQQKVERVEAQPKRAEPSNPRPPPTVAPPPKLKTVRRALRYGERGWKKGNMVEAVHGFKSVVALNPAHAFAHKRLGDSEANRGNLQAARAGYKTYLALRPNAPDKRVIEDKIDKLAQLEKLENGK